MTDAAPRGTPGHVAGSAPVDGATVAEVAADDASDPGHGASRRPSSRRALDLLDTHRSTVVGALTTWVLGVAVAPVAGTRYRSDDLVNSGVQDGFAPGPWGALRGSASWVVEVTGLWVRTEGRFFPGSAAWTMAVFGIAPSEAAYKVVLALLGAAALLLAAAVTATLVRTGAAVPVVVVATAGVLTLRPWFDGLDTFSGVVPLTACLTLGALLLLLRGRGRLSAVAAVVAWTYALLTYEVAILLTPVLCLVVLVHGRSRRRASLPLLPAAAVSVLVLVLRAHAAREGAAYAASLEPGAVLATYGKQVAAPLPLAQVWFPRAEVPVVQDVALLPVMAVAVGLPVLVLLLCVARSPAAARATQLRWAAVLGAATWWCTPLLVAVSAGWQQELPRGQGYLAVVWGYLGIGVLAAAGWLALARRRAHRGGRATTAALVLASLALAAAVVATSSLSITVARSMVPAGA